MKEGAVRNKQHSIDSERSNKYILRFQFEKRIPTTRIKLRKSNKIKTKTKHPEPLFAETKH
jgi:hypothetical protein